MNCKECNHEVLRYGKAWHCECNTNDEWILVRKEEEQCLFLGMVTVWVAGMNLVVIPH